MTRLFETRRFAAALLLAGTCFAAHAAGVDDDLREAARLHKGGDTTQAVAIWKGWANKGSADAAYNLAVIHQYEDGVELDYTTAMRWYKVSAEQGDRSSQRGVPSVKWSSVTTDTRGRER